MAFVDREIKIKVYGVSVWDKHCGGVLVRYGPTESRVTRLLTASASGLLGGGEVSISSTGKTTLSD